MATCTMALGTMAAETGLHTGVWVYPGVWIPNRGHLQVFGYTQLFGSPNHSVCVRCWHGQNRNLRLSESECALHQDEHL